MDLPTGSDHIYTVVDIAANALTGKRNPAIAGTAGHPIVQLVMRSDRVSAEDLRALLRTDSAKLTRAPESATDAAEHLPPQGLFPPQQPVVT